MTAENPTNAERVQDFGLAIFGPEWGAPMGRLAGVNQRTMSRIKVAAQDGKDYPAAAGVLAALAEAVDAFALQLKPWHKPAKPVSAPVATTPAPKPVKAVPAKAGAAGPVDALTGETVKPRGALQKGAKR